MEMFGIFCAAARTFLSSCEGNQRISLKSTNCSVISLDYCLKCSVSIFLSMVWFNLLMKSSFSVQTPALVQMVHYLSKHSAYVWLFPLNLSNSQPLLNLSNIAGLCKNSMK